MCKKLGTVKLSSLLETTQLVRAGANIHTQGASSRRFSNEEEKF